MAFPVAAALLTACNGSLVITVPNGRLPVPTGSPGATASATPTPLPTGGTVGPGQAVIGFAGVGNVGHFKIVVDASGKTTTTFIDGPGDGAPKVGSIPPTLAQKLFADLAAFRPSPPPPVACEAAAIDWQTLEWGSLSLTSQGCPSGGLQGDLLMDVNAIEAALGLSTQGGIPTPVPSPAGAGGGTVVITHRGAPQPDGLGMTSFEIDVTPGGQVTYSKAGGPFLAAPVPLELTRQLVADASQRVPPPPPIDCAAMRLDETTVTYGGQTFSDQPCGGYWPKNLADDVTKLENLLGFGAASPTPTPMPSVTVGPLDLGGDWQSGTQDEPPPGPVKAPPQQCYVLPSFTLVQKGNQISGSVPQPVTGAAPQFRTNTTIAGTIDGNHVQLKFTSLTTSFLGDTNQPAPPPTTTTVDLFYDATSQHLSGKQTTYGSDGTSTTQPYWAARWIGNGLNCPPPP